MTKKNDAEELNVTARAPFHVYYEGPAHVVTAKNKVGMFDILPGHADFFSVLSPCDVIIETNDPKADPITFKITNGMITARDNDIMLFVNM